MQIARPTSADETLDMVADQLSVAGAKGELSYGLLERLRINPAAWGDDVKYMVATSDDEPVALVTQTGTHPALIVGFAAQEDVDFAAIALHMSKSGWLPTSINGADQWSTALVKAWRAICGANYALLRQLRAFELYAVIPPLRPPAGNVRAAATGDRAVLVGWANAFEVEALGTEEQGADNVKLVDRLLGDSDLAVWEHDGTVRSMAAINRRTPRSSCVSLVYTPPAHRRAGYAGAVVAALSQRELDAGQNWCSLFTDVENPTSNHIYMELGYEPKCDFVHYSLTH